MLLAYQGQQFGQQEIASAAGVEETVTHHGSRVDQLAQAVDSIAPGYRLYGKYNATINDLKKTLTKLRLPVAVEWQGAFYNAETSERFDLGHYSVITGFSETLAELDIVDPDPCSLYLNGKIDVAEFEERWWENNNVPTNLGIAVTHTTRLIFVVLPIALEAAAGELGFVPVNLQLLQSSGHVVSYKEELK